MLLFHVSSGYVMKQLSLNGCISGIQMMFQMNEADMELPATPRLVVTGEELAYSWSFICGIFIDV